MSKLATVFVRGRALKCQHCGGNQFRHENVRLDRMVLGFIHLEGIWGTEADIYGCGHCGFLHWFFPIPGVVREGAVPDAKAATAPEVETVPEPDAPELGADAATEPTECLSCGKPIPVSATSCPACGWSWKMPMGDEPGT